jgi:hypothetical protein
MSKGIEKPSFSELLKDLQFINDNRESINTIDIVRLNWLIIHLDKMLFDKFRSIDGLISANHKSKDVNYTKVEFWKTNLRQYGFNYYDLEYFKSLILKQKEELKKQSHQKITHKIFYDNGFEWFEFLVNNYKGSTPTIKLTAVYNVLLRFHKIRDNQNLYKDFIINDFSNELNVGSKTLKFSRFADTTAYSYNSTYNKLMVLIENKFKTHNN